MNRMLNIEEFDAICRRYWLNATIWEDLARWADDGGPQP